MDMPKWRASFGRTLGWFAVLLFCMAALLLAEHIWLWDRIVQKFRSHPSTVAFGLAAVGFAISICVSVGLDCMKLRKDLTRRTVPRGGSSVGGDEGLGHGR